MHYLSSTQNQYEFVHARVRSLKIQTRIPLVFFKGLRTVTVRSLQVQVLRKQQNKKTNSL